MIKLHASYGRKVPAGQEYSSESFHATAEVELADSFAGNPDALKGALHRLWGELKTAVAEQIQGRRSQAALPADSPVPRHAPAGPERESGTAPVAASKKQIGFLLSLARRKRNLSAEQTRAWLRSERGVSLDAITKSQATALIDELNQ